MIKRDFLHQEDGGTTETDTAASFGINTDTPAVTAEISGSEISLSDASMAAAEMSTGSFEAVV
jgi:hypothetical protein